MYKNIEIESSLLIDDEISKKITSSLNSLFKNQEVNKVLLINPPDGDDEIFNYDVAKTGRYTNFAPYGLGIISEHLKHKKYETKILNLNHLVLEKVEQLKKDDFDYNEIIKSEIEKCINDFSPDLIGITCMFSMTNKYLKNVTKILKQLSNKPIAAGGVHISNSLFNTETRETVIKELEHIDLFFLFEAELAFSEFLDQVNNNFSNISMLKQILLKNEDGTIFIKDRLRPEGETLNVIPNHKEMFSYSLSKYGKVGNFNWLKNKNEHITTVLSNRGCRAQCSFCSVRNFNGVTVRQRSVQSVVDELLYLKDKQKIDHIMWLDDDLLYNTKRTMELFNEMIRQDVGITWDASNGVIAASVTDEIMSAAEESGCIGVVIGMESGNPKILREIRKPGTVKNFIKASEILKNYPKINSRVFLMIGFPGETFGQVLDTINVSREMQMDWNYITPLQPLPNTPIFDKMIDDNLSGTEGFGEIKYFVGGGYAKISSGQSKNPLQDNFEDIFKKKNLDLVPDPNDTKIIWAFMNYFLNFEPLNRVYDKEKLQQNVKWMRYVSDTVAQNDPIALYYKLMLEKRIDSQSQNVVESEIRIKNIFKSSPEWKQKVDALGLNFDQI